MSHDFSSPTASMSFEIPSSAIPRGFSAEDITWSAVDFDPATKKRTIKVKFKRSITNQLDNEVALAESITIEYLGKVQQFDYGFHKFRFNLFSKIFNISIPYFGYLTKDRTVTYQKVETHKISNGQETKTSKIWERH